MKLPKRTPPTTCLTFLGVQLDTVAGVASLPTDKLTAILQELHTFSTLTRCTKRALLSLIGKLSFAAKVIPAWRIFIQRLIDASTRVSSNHHHIPLSAAMRADIHWWRSFAQTWNWKSFFLDHWWTPSRSSSCSPMPVIRAMVLTGESTGSMAPGPSASSDTPCSGKNCTVLLAAVTWGAQWGKKRLLVHCDNQAVVHIWRTGTSKHESLMILVRTLFFTAASHNFTILLHHIQGVNNSMADALSRSEFHRFKHLAPNADKEPTPIPVVEMCN